MTDVTTTIEDYMAIWNETDPARRRALVERTFTGDARYVDPLMAGEGPEAIDAMVAGAQAQYPGHRFALAQGPDAHNDRVRFAWHLFAPDGTGPLATGNRLRDRRRGRTAPRGDRVPRARRGRLSAYSAAGGVARRHTATTSRTVAVR